jgi:hypothetical protein
MATATKKSGAASQLTRRPAELIFEENDGDHRWTIVARDGTTLAQLERFASYDDAEHDDLIARRDAKNDDLDAQRWSDEGGSVISEAVAAWPVQR